MKIEIKKKLKVIENKVSNFVYHNSEWLLPMITGVAVVGAIAIANAIENRANNGMKLMELSYTDDLGYEMKTMVFVDSENNIYPAKKV